MRVVLDANQFVSAVLVAWGHPAQIMQAWRQQRFELVLSPSLIAEIRRVLLYPRLQRKHGWSVDQTNDFLAEVVAAATIVPDGPEVHAVPGDPSDDKYIACALSAGAHYLVSGDEHLLQVGEYQGLRIVSPALFLKELC